MSRQYVFVTDRVECGIHESSWLQPGVYLACATDPRVAEAGLLYVSLEIEPNKIFACITNRCSPVVTILDEVDAAHVRGLTAERVSDLPPVHVTLPSGTRLAPGRIAELVDVAAVQSSPDGPRPRYEANREGKAGLDQTTRRLWHSSRHALCPSWLAGRIQDDVTRLREEFRLPRFDWNDAITDEEVGRCSVHPEECAGQHTHNPPV